MKKFVTIVIFAAFTAALAPAFAQEAQPPEAKPKEEKPFRRERLAWLSLLKEKLDVSMSATQEYDDNVFLDERDRHWDWKTTLTPAAYLEQQWDKAYLGLGYQAEATRYLEYARWVVTQQTDADFNWNVRPDWTVGLKDTHIHAGQAWAPTGAGDDRILRLGFNINTFLAQSKIKLSDGLSMTNEYQLDYINFTDPNQDTYIDRNADEGRAMLAYDFTPRTTGLAGYAYRWVGYHAREADNKDFTANKAHAGLRQKFTRLFTAELILEEEWRNFTEGGDDNNLNARAAVTSTFSRLTSFSLRYARSLGDSSRSEYRQYLSDRLAGILRHHLDPKTVLFLSTGYERQFYDKSDQLVATLEQLNRKTFLYSADLTLRRFLNSWLFAEISYRYSKRDTDFAREGHTNNRYSVGLKGSW